MVSLIWAMIILPLADVLMNCLQNVISRKAGLNNEQVTNRIMGMGTMLGFGLGAIKEQFNSSNNNNISTNRNENNGSSSNGGFKNFISRAKEVVSPSINLTDEKDYNGNINPIQNVIPKNIKEKHENLKVTPTYSEKFNSYEQSDDKYKNKNINSNENRNVNMHNTKTIINKIAHTGLNATKTYLELGAQMAEGNFKKSPYKYNYKNKKNTFKNPINTGYENKTKNNNIQKLGDKNEYKK